MYTCKCGGLIPEIGDYLEEDARCKCDRLEVERLTKALEDIVNITIGVTSLKQAWVSNNVIAHRATQALKKGT